MRSMVTRFLGASARRQAMGLAQGWRPRSALLRPQTRVAAFASSAQEPPTDTPAAHKDEPALPSHIKFRMPDLDFQDLGGNAKEGTTLSKWFIREGQEVKDGVHMCEIDTPDLCFTLEAGDEGFIARLLVVEGTTNVTAGQPLAIIVPTEAEIEPFVEALKQNPEAVEGYAKSVSATSAIEAEKTETSAPPTESAASSDVLRMLHKLQKEGRFEDEHTLKVLKSLARKNDSQLLTTYKGSFEDGVLEEAAFDKDFFVENALELAQEAAQEQSNADKVE